MLGAVVSLHASSAEQGLQRRESQTLFRVARGRDMRHQVHLANVSG